MKKISSTETTIFVYDFNGQLAAEYSTALASTPQVSYLTSDHLGSPRVITNENGAVTSRKDFSAFGEETITSQRNSALGYNPPRVRQDYTGYEKDSETGLEYAQARYYNSQHGRFTSVDPLTASAAIRDPQTFNRYSYALNSPYKFVDPLGLLSENTAACGMRCANSGPWVDGSAFSGRDASGDMFTMKQTTPQRSLGQLVAAAFAAWDGMQMERNGYKGWRPPVPLRYFDLRQDPAIVAEVKKIAEKRSPLQPGESSVLTTVQVIVGNTAYLVNGEYITGHGVPMVNFTGVIRPIAYIGLDQGGNIIALNGMAVAEKVTLIAGQMPVINDVNKKGTLVHSPASGVYIDIQSLGEGDPTTTIVQITYVGQYDRSGRLRKLISIGPNPITKDASKRTVTVEIGGPKIEYPK